MIENVRYLHESYGKQKENEEWGMINWTIAYLGFFEKLKKIMILLMSQINIHKYIFITANLIYLEHGGETCPLLFKSGHWMGNKWQPHGCMMHEYTSR